MAEGRKMGEWAFIVGVLIAIVVSLFSVSDAVAGWLVLLLVVLGLIVGLLNVTEKETTPFLIAAAALLITGTAGGSLAIIPVIGGYLQDIVQNIAVFVAPAAIVVALKAIQSLAKD
ncbi:hypothetical protein HYX03_00315 [Candidatus Woesearchaeota archaeon]|nr:hypothetical protein [Candidatus Woesearchaeota archaeon]